MPITQLRLANWIQKNESERLYFRVSPDTLIPWVLRSGLQPRSITGVASRQPNLASRENHVYLGTSSDPNSSYRSGVGFGDPHFWVEIASLDPERFCSDEDRITAHSALHDKVSHLPGYGSLSWPTPRTPEVALWMDKMTSIVDQEEWVEFSLDHGSVAYRGGIPPALLNATPAVADQWLTASGTSWPERVPTDDEVAPYLKKPLVPAWKIPNVP
jgi:hypothetical protein